MDKFSIGTLVLATALNKTGGTLLPELNGRDNKVRGNCKYKCVES